MTSYFRARPFDRASFVAPSRVVARRTLVIALACYAACGGPVGCGGGGGGKGAGGATPNRSAVPAVVAGDRIDLLPALWESGASPDLEAGAPVDLREAEIDFADPVSFDRVKAASAAHRHVRDVRVVEDELHFGVEKSGNVLAWDVDFEAADVTHVLVEGITAPDARGPVHLLWKEKGAPPDAWAHASFLIRFGGAENVLVPVEDSSLWRGRIGRMGLQFGVRQNRIAQTGGAIPVRLIGIRYRKMDLGTRRDEEKRPRSIRRIEIDREFRAVAHLPAPARAAARLRIPEGGVLSFAVGVHPAATNKRGDGVEVVARFEDGGGEASRELFRTTLDPRTDAEARGWLDVRVDLAALAGREGRIVFESRPLGDPSYDHAMIGHPAVFAAKSAGPPNVLMVSLDTVRADHLGCYGYGRATSPQIDAFAEDATVFERASTAAPETVSAHMSLFTSLYPFAHGIREIFAAERLNPGVPTLAERLREDAGFATAAFTEGGGMHASVGFDRGFDIYSIGEIQPHRGQKMVETTFGNATEWLRANADRRFFLFVHSYEAHTPYDPPAPYADRFYPDYEGPVAAPVSAETVESLVLGGAVRYGDANVDRIVSLYDGAIAYLDDHVGRLLGEVEALGLREDTIVVLFSDHGEDFFDHFSLATHGHSLYEELMHVALVVRVPGLDSPARVPDTVSLVDVMPTLLELCGSPPLEPRQGESLVPLLSGESMPLRSLLLQDPTGLPRFGIRRGSMKRIETPGVEDNSMTELVRRFSDVVALDRFDGIFEELEVYDLATDPRERRNLASGPDPDPEPDAWLRDEHARSKVRDAKLFEAHPPFRAGKVSDEARTRLGELGYTADAEPADSEEAEAEEADAEAQGAPREGGPRY